MRCNDIVEEYEVKVLLVIPASGYLKTGQRGSLHRSDGAPNVVVPEVVAEERGSEVRAEANHSEYPRVDLKNCHLAGC